MSGRLPTPPTILVCPDFRSGLTKLLIAACLVGQASTIAGSAAASSGPEAANAAIMAKLTTPSCPIRYARGCVRFIMTAFPVTDLGCSCRGMLAVEVERIHPAFRSCWRSGHPCPRVGDLSGRQCDALPARKRLFTVRRTVIAGPRIDDCARSRQAVPMIYLPCPMLHPPWCRHRGRWAEQIPAEHRARKRGCHSCADESVANPHHAPTPSMGQPVNMDRCRSCEPSHSPTRCRSELVGPTKNLRA